MHKGTSDCWHDHGGGDFLFLGGVEQVLDDGQGELDGGAGALGRDDVTIHYDPLLG